MGTPMIKEILVLVLVCTLIFPLGLTAKEKRGADLLVEKLDGQLISGELITIKDRSLLLLSESGADVTVDVEDVNAITVLKKSKAWQGARTGALLSVGWIAIAALLSVGDLDISEIQWNSLTYIVLSSTLIGATIGALSGKDETIPFSIKSISEKQVILEKLRMKARVIYYQ